MKPLRFHYRRVIAFFAAILLGACAGTRETISEGFRESPIGSVATGETRSVKSYLKKVEQENIKAREAEQFEFNKQETRAYNTETGRYEYVPEDSQQRWNEEKQRWEFTPARSKDGTP